MRCNQSEALKHTSDGQLPSAPHQIVFGVVPKWSGDGVCDLTTRSVIRYINANEYDIKEISEVSLCSD